MPLGSHLLLLALPLLPLRQDRPVADGTAATQSQRPESATETPAPPRPPQPIQYSSAWLGVLGQDWRPLDDPQGSSLPQPFLKLPGDREACFESISRTKLMIVRRLPHGVEALDGFMADEELLSRQGSFIPVEDRVLEDLEAVEEGGETTLEFDCEWTQGSLSARIASLYAPTAGGEVLCLWLVSTDDTPFVALQTELELGLKAFNARRELAPLKRYRGVLNNHEVAFNLGIENKFQLEPMAFVEGAQADIVLRIQEANPTFLATQVRQWRDVKRGLTLSYQAIVNDTPLGPIAPFVYWLSGQFQLSMRQDPDDGDIPVDLLHRENARSEVIGEEALSKHYKNCRRTAGPGVILETFLPRSPYARVCRMGWGEAPEGQPPTFGRIWFVELRHYHLSRGEMVSGVGVVVLWADGKSEAELDLLEESLDFVSRPLEAGPPFPGSQR